MTKEITEKQRRKIREVARKEIAKGKTMPEVFAMAKAVGISQEVLGREIEKLNKTEFWDPCSENIYSKSFEKANAKNIATLEKYTADPRRPLKILGFFSIPGIITIILVLLFPKEIFGFFSSGDDDSIQVLLIPFIPFFLYWARIFSLQRDLVKYSIARDQNWVYSPNDRPSRWREFRARFSEIFERGNKSQNISDEFWGDFSSNGKATDFWTGIFSYTIKRGKNSTKYKRTIFGFRLEKPLKTRFCLKPENSVFGFFRRNKEIEVESGEFNKAFSVYYNGQKTEKEMEIVKILSPSLQVRLLEMRKNEGSFEVLFVDDVMLFSFSGKLIKKMKSNFFKKIEIAAEDMETIKNRLRKVFSLGVDMARFLD